MRIPIRAVPIEKWPLEKPTPYPGASPFSTPFERTLADLDRELSMLSARNVVLRGFFAPRHIRGDGWVYADATPLRSGVILSFTSRGAALSFPCDRYRKWQDNVRAIALSLQALRAVDRYGVTRQAEQYRGWAQIEAPQADPFPTLQHAAEFIALKAYGDLKAARDILQNSASRETAYRQAARRLHPDQGGSHEEFVLLQKAKSHLEAR